MNSFFTFFTLFLAANTVGSQYHHSGHSGSTAQSQYPRIKIGGPLGQLMPNGFQLGAGLGSVLNSLIGQTDGGQLATAPSSPYAALRTPFGQQFGGTAGGQQYPIKYNFGQQMSPQNAFQNLYGGGNNGGHVASAPLMGHSSQLGSTNSEPYSQTQQLFD